jgi:hypothetical protein
MKAKVFDTKAKELPAEEPASPYMRTFSSQEEAERFNMIENVEKSDMEKFRLFCRMMRIGKMLASAKIVK